MKKPIRPGSSRLTGGVEADPGLSNPYQKTTYARGESDRRMRDSRAGFEHETSDASDRDVRAYCARQSLVKGEAM